MGDLPRCPGEWPMGSHENCPPWHNEVGYVVQLPVKGSERYEKLVFYADQNWTAEQFVYAILAALREEE